MTRQTVTLYNMQQGHAELMRLWTWCKSMLAAEHRLTVEARPEKRSDAQSRLMWSALGDLSRQITWHGMKLSAEDWKCMCTASLKKQRAVPGLDGQSFVVLGQPTSTMTKAEMTELIDLIHCTGAEHGVQWSPASIAQDFTEPA
jgi:NinB protein